MSDYKLYFLGSDGHIARAKNLCCAGDAEAIRLALNHPRDQAMELWQGQTRLRSMPANGGSPDGSMPYVVYLMEDDAIVAVTTVDAADDATAIAIAGHIFRACDDECDAYEVWQNGRWVHARMGGRIFEDPLADSNLAMVQETLAALQRRHQNLVIEREMRLQDSYAAIRRSRKLLNSIEKLRPLYGSFD